MFARCGIAFSRIAKQHVNPCLLHSKAALAIPTAGFSDVSAAAEAAGSNAAETHAVWSFKQVDTEIAKKKLRAAADASSKEQLKRGA